MTEFYHDHFVEDQVCDFLTLVGPCEKAESKSSMSGKAIVLDANILIRAVLGKQVRDNAAAVKFFAQDVADADARKYLPALVKKRGADATTFVTRLDSRLRQE